MSAESEVERLIASIADRASVDWDAAERSATDDAERARISALRGVSRIAAFSHEEWERIGPLPVGTREPAVGDRVGAYTLEARIGRGGMGEVWSARRSDGRFEGRVAIKLLRSPLAGRHGRFQREGEILARLRHPHIAQLLDAGVTVGGHPYLVLELVEGVAIDRYCEEHALPLRARIRLFADVLGAVAHAHANLVLHRDLKPSNIAVDREGRVKLLDFGIAKLLEDESGPGGESDVTLQVGRAFTPEFAAPEQLLGEPVTTATDVYSAGVVLYLLLAGHHPRPLGEGSALERMKAALESEPRPASAVAREGGPAHPAARWARELRGDLDNILARALKQRPEERYANALALADDLRRYLDQEPVLARPDTLRYRASKFVRRHRGAVLGVTGAVVALVVLSIVALSERAEARRQRDEAREQARRAEAFTGVVTSLLSQAGPGGHALTPEELLDRAVAEMTARYRDDPAFLVGMLIRISGRYFDLQDTNKELETLIAAERIARTAGDAALIFDVQVNTVETELAAGHLREATRRIEEARRLLPRLRPVPELDDYLRAEGKVARSNGDIPAAIGYLERARTLLESAGHTQGNAYPGILSELAVCHSAAGDLRKTYDVGLKIAECDRRNGRERSMPGIVSRASLAYCLYGLGEVRRAHALLREIMPEIEHAGERMPPAIAMRYGDVLSRLGSHADALPLLDDAVQAADRGGNRSMAIRTRLALGRALVRARKAAEARRTLDQAADAMRAPEQGDAAWLAEVSRLRAEIDLAERRPGDAEREATAALARLGYPATRRAPGLAGAVLTLARVQIARGRSEQAARSARDALALFERDSLDPARSADVGEASLVLATALRASGAPEEARRAVRRALACLNAGLGPDHSAAREAARLAARW